MTIAKGKVKKCPKCGHNVFYKKERIKGNTVFCFTNDGEEADNSDIYMHVEHTLRSKYAYCEECHSRVYKLEPEEIY